MKKLSTFKQCKKKLDLTKIKGGSVPELALAQKSVTLDDVESNAIPELSLAQK